MGKDQGKEVFIRQDPAIGDVILSRKPDSWDGFFKRLQSAEVPEDFLVDRSDAPPQARELF
jgi:antitoxin VapB